jgi:hypothetical protein
LTSKTKELPNSEDEAENAFKTRDIADRKELPVALHHLEAVELVGWGARKDSLFESTMAENSTANFRFDDPAFTIAEKSDK